MAIESAKKAKPRHLVFKRTWELGEMVIYAKSRHFGRPLSGGGHKTKQRVFSTTRVAVGHAAFALLHQHANSSKLHSWVNGNVWLTPVMFSYALQRSNSKQVRGGASLLYRSWWIFHDVDGSNESSYSFLLLLSSVSWNKYDKYDILVVFDCWKLVITIFHFVLRISWYNFYSGAKDLTSADFFGEQKHVITCQKSRHCVQSLKGSRSQDT